MGFEPYSDILIYVYGELKEDSIFFKRPEPTECRRFSKTTPFAFFTKNVDGFRKSFLIVIIKSEIQ